MALQLEKVHEMERDAGGRDVLVRSNPYARFVDSTHGQINVQAGRFYSSGLGQPVIPFKDVPDWAWKALRAMSPEGRLSIGMPEDVEGIAELPEPEPEAEPSKDAQSLGDVGEPGKTLVDYIYELDHSIAAHWTKKGLPDLNALTELTGKRVSRGEAESAAPDYRRKES